MIDELTKTQIGSFIEKMNEWKGKYTTELINVIEQSKQSPEMFTDRFGELKWDTTCGERDNTLICGKDEWIIFHYSVNKLLLGSISGTFAFSVTNYGTFNSFDSNIKGITTWEGKYKMPNDYIILSQFLLYMSMCCVTESWHDRMYTGQPSIITAVGHDKYAVSNNISLIRKCFETIQQINEKYWNRNCVGQKALEIQSENERLKSLYDQYTEDRKQLDSEKERFLVEKEKIKQERDAFSSITGLAQFEQDKTLLAKEKEQWDNESGRKFIAEEKIRLTQVKEQLSKMKYAIGEDRKKLEQDKKIFEDRLKPSSLEDLII